ncbi:MAG: EamA family transporter [Steroidobacteraceae bacterium]
MAPASGHRAKLILCFAIVYLVWGSTYLVIRIAVQSLPPFLFAGIRFVGAGTVLFLLARVLGTHTRIDAVTVRKALLVSFCGVVIANGATMWGIQWVPSNQAALLNASGAFWIVLFGGLGARAHRPSARVLTGLMIGFVGTALIVWRGGGGGAQPNYMLAQIAILTGCIGWATGIMLFRNIQPHSDLFSFVGLQMLFGGGVLTLLGIASGELQRWNWSPAGIAELLYMMLASSCVAYTAFAWLARNVAPASVSTYSYVNPAIATLLGWLVLDERLTGTQLLGVVVMLAGVVLVTWPARGATLAQASG